MKKTAILFLLALAMFSCNKSENANNSQARTEAALDVIKTRVSVRHFTGEKLTDAQIDTILRAGMSAPTAVNKQPWAFVVVDDPETLMLLSDTLKSSRIENGASHAIAVCGNLQKALEGEGQGYWVEDTSAATENMLLAAHAMGLGGLWVGVYPISERVKSVSEILGLPNHIVPMCLVVLGYPNEQPEVKDKFLQENIHYNKW